MRERSLWRALLGIEKTVIESVEFDEDHDEGAGCVIVHVRPVAKSRHRCGRCLRRGRVYDPGRGRRRWRSLDLGTTLTLKRSRFSAVPIRGAALG